MMGDIYHWNINGLKCKKSINYKEKTQTLTSILENNNSTFILNVQETHIPSECDLPKFFNLYKHIYHFENTFSRNEDPSSGILICIRKTEEIIIREIIVNGRLLYLKIKNTATNRIYNIYSIYSKSGNSEKQKSLISKLREKIMLNQTPLENCIILGDINFATSLLDRNSQCLNRVDLETNKMWAP